MSLQHVETLRHISLQVCVDIPNGLEKERPLHPASCLKLLHIALIELLSNKKLPLLHYVVIHEIGVKALLGAASDPVRPCCFGDCLRATCFDMDVELVMVKMSE